MPTLLDTSVLIDALRGHTPAVSWLRAVLMVERPCLSELSRFELLAGLRPSQLPQVEDISLSFDWLRVDEAVSREGGRLARQFRSGFNGVDDVDFLIAATAINHGLALATMNVRHFPMFPGLKPPY